MIRVAVARSIDPDVLVRRVGVAVVAGRAEGRERHPVARTHLVHRHRARHRHRVDSATGRSRPRPRHRTATTTGWSTGDHQAGSPSRSTISTSPNPCSSRWRRSAATTSAGRCSGTIRMSMRACASAGITVFGVGLDVAGPQALQVEGRLEGQHLGSGDPVEARGEPFDALVLAHVVEVPEVRGRDDRTLGVGRGDDAGVEALDGRPALRVPQRRQRGDHALPRVRQQGRHARVRIDHHRPQVEVQDDDALAAGGDRRAGRACRDCRPR